jgi:hypothetical protein
MEVRRDLCDSNPLLYVIQAILDFSKEVDVSLIDRVVATCFTGSGQEVSKSI